MNFDWVKGLFPRTLYGRAAAILLLPILTLQLAVTLVFLQRHFEGVTRQMTLNLVREISFILEELETHSLDEVVEVRAERLELNLRRWDGVPSDNARRFIDVSGLTVIPTLYDNLPGVRDVDLSAPSWVVVAIESAKGPISIGFSRKRVSATNPHQVLVWMVFTGFVITIIAFIFLRNQLRPIKRLAAAAEAFGRGKSVPLNPSGAIEVRAAGNAFLDMRQRIERQIEQRTLMLSGVSHDLRTPLTRMQLQLGLMDGPDAQSLQKDVDEMSAMISGFLDFSRHANLEKAVEIDLAQMLLDLCKRCGPNVAFDVKGVPFLTQVRSGGLRRAVDNLVQNALRYGTRCNVTLEYLKKSVRIRIEDDGPGIAQEDQASALRPFVRLDAARNQNKGSGVGLGLAITADVARSHGGALVLGSSEALGGLQADLTLPRIVSSEDW